MYTIVPFRRAFDSAFAPLFNDHFMREFFDCSNAPEMRVDVREKEDASAGGGFAWRKEGRHQP